MCPLVLYLFNTVSLVGRSTDELDVIDERCVHWCDICLMIIGAFSVLWYDDESFVV